MLGKRKLCDSCNKKRSECRNIDCICKRLNKLLEKEEEVACPNIYDFVDIDWKTGAWKTIIEDDKPKSKHDYPVYWHLLWIPSLISLGVGSYLYFKKSKKKKKLIAKSQFDNAKESYFEWRSNVYLWVTFYVLFFVLVGQAITKITPTIREWIKNPVIDLLLILPSSLILGGLSVWDGYITSTLKTPLQRIAMKAESANIAEKDRKELLSKTQTMNELFKETFKKFGLLTFPAMFKTTFKGSKYLWILDAWLFFALFVGVWQIFEMNKTINEIRELKTITKTNKEIE